MTTLRFKDVLLFYNDSSFDQEEELHPIHAEFVIVNALLVVHMLNILSRKKFIF